MPSSLRILVVDDDPVLLKSLHDILETDGHLVSSTNGGQEGIDAFLAAQGRGEPDLRNEEGDRQIEVRVDALPSVVADPVLLKQVFFNLLSNAFKFTRNKEGALIEIGGERKTTEAIYWVQDNGAG